MTPTPDLMRGVILHFSAGRGAAMALASFDEKGLKSMAQLGRGPFKKFKSFLGGEGGTLPLLDGICKAEFHFNAQNNCGEGGFKLLELTDRDISFHNKTLYFFLAFAPKGVNDLTKFFYLFDDMGGVDRER